MEDFRIELGRIFGKLESSKEQLDELKTIVNTGFKTVIEECNKNIRVHSATCPIDGKLDKHVLKQEEHEKYKIERRKEQLEIKSNKVNWFKWVISLILGTLGIKGIYDIIFHGSNKVIK